jgi:hypothetical protein
VGLGLVFLFVVAAFLLGVRSQTVQATSGDLVVDVTYPGVGRRGLATPLEVHVSLPAPGRVVVWLNNAYLGQLDHNSWVPEPAEILTQGFETGLVFEPESELLEVNLDTRFAPSVRPGRHPLHIRIEAASESIVFELTTWVVP